MEKAIERNQWKRRNHQNEPAETTETVETSKTKRNRRNERSRYYHWEHMNPKQLHNIIWSVRQTKSELTISYFLNEFQIDKIKNK